MNEVKLSPALELLRLTWNGVHDNKAMWSWARLNRCMSSALHLAIESGLNFGIDDFAYIAHNFRWSWWAGDAEQFYCHAVIENNMPAIKAYEHHCNRKPFIVNSIWQYHGMQTTPRRRGRLAIGSHFEWQGETVSVTSFDDKNGRIIACSYDRVTKDGFLPNTTYETNKVKHIYKLGHKDFRVNKLIKAQTQALA